MDMVKRFYDRITKDEEMLLATRTENGVAMRIVSPVYYENAILFFTGADSNKFKQLRTNPNCCIAVGGMFAEAVAEFLGPTMDEKNRELRDAYCTKFNLAFEEGIENGGRDAEFLLLTPKKLTGWGFVNDNPTEDGVPNFPFEITLD